MLKKYYVFSVMFAGLLLSGCGGGSSGPTQNTSPSAPPTPSPSPTPNTSPAPTIEPTITPSTEPTTAPSPPNAIDDTWATSANEAVSDDVLGNDTGTDISITEIRAEQNGTAQLAAGVITFTPASNFIGNASFEYKIEDSSNQFDWATVSVSVSVPSNNNPPNAEADQATIYEGQTATVSPLDNDSDVDGHAINLVSVTSATNGQAVIQGDDILYTPSANFTGTDQFNYTVEDIFGVTNSATIVVTVNKRPTLEAVNDFVNTNIGTGVEFDVVENDLGIVSVDDMTLTLGTSTGPGSFQLGASSFLIEYVPDASAEGVAVVNYEIEDGSGTSSQAEFKVRVHPATTAIKSVDITTLDDGQVTQLTDFPSGSSTTISSAFSRADTDNSSQEDLVMMVQNAGDIGGVDSDFIYSIFPFSSRLPSLSMATFESNSNTAGQLLHFQDDELIDLQSPINIDGNEDGKNDFVFLDNFSLLYRETVTPPPAIVDLSTDASEHSASASDYPIIMSMTGFDINGDAVDDLAVASMSGEGIPAIQVFYGPMTDYDNVFATELDGTKGFMITGFEPITAAADLTLSSGDLNGDGHDDLVIGSLHQKNTNDEKTGEVYVVWGGSSSHSNFSIGTFINDNQGASSRTSPNGTTISWQGSNTESIGGVITLDDVNADGTLDLILGNSTRTHLGSGQYMLATSIVYGADDWPNIIELSEWSESDKGQRIIFNKELIDGQPSAQIIYGLAAGDINADGYSDILLQLLTEVVAVLGGSAIKPDVIDAGGITTDWPTVNFSVPSKGVSPIAALDLDADGFSDVVITRSNGSSLDGFVVYGGLQFNP